MSAVKRAAKISLYVFSVFVIFVVCAAIYFYVNMGSIAKQITERVASDVLDVPVKIGAMDIVLENNSIAIQDIRIFNPAGYKNAEAITIDTIDITVKSFSKALLTFDVVGTNGVKVDLEVYDKGTNLGDIQHNIENFTGTQRSQNSESVDNLKVMINQVALTKIQLSPSVVLIEKPLAIVNIPDVYLNNVGKNSGGVLVSNAVAEIMSAVLQQFNKSAGQEGLLQGLSLETLNTIGLTAADVFTANLKGGVEKNIKPFQPGIDGFKKIDR